jgi:hypothetical protein
VEATLVMDLNLRMELMLTTLLLLQAQVHPQYVIDGATTASGYTGGIFALRGGSYLIQSTALTGGGIQINGTQL